MKVKNRLHDWHPQTPIYQRAYMHACIEDLLRDYHIPRGPRVTPTTSASLSIPACKEALDFWSKTISLALALTTSPDARFKPVLTEEYRYEFFLACKVFLLCRHKIKNQIKCLPPKQKQNKKIWHKGSSTLRQNKENWINGKKKKKNTLWEGGTGRIALMKTRTQISERERNEKIRDTQIPLLWKKRKKRGCHDWGELGLPWLRNLLRLQIWRENYN